jgi:hypothetical protein
MSYKRIEGTMTFEAQCKRCGYLFTFSERTLLRGGYDTEHCGSCKAVPALTIWRNGVRCVPWQGDFDLDNYWPLKDGQPHLVGPRSCGNADCVVPSHVQLQALAC